MAKKRARNIGEEILEGLREIKRGEIGRAVVKEPKADSIEELARFWDSHEVTEFEDQLEEVAEPVFERREAAVAPRLEPGE